MDFSPAERMFSHLPFDCVLLGLLLLTSKSGLDVCNWVVQDKDTRMAVVIFAVVNVWKQSKYL